MKSDSSSNGNHFRVLITRRRWDIFFLLQLALVECVSFIVAFIEDRWLLALSPIGMLPLWLALRYQIPKEGRWEPTISGTPGLIPMLIWGSFILTLAAILGILDWFLFGHGFHDPLKWYHYVATLIIVILMCAGGYVIDKKFIKPKKSDNDLEQPLLQDETEMFDSPKGFS